MRQKIMRSKNAGKPSTLVSVIVGSTLVLDGLNVLLLGLIIFAIAGMADPIDWSLETKEANIRMGSQVLLITFVYFLFCILAFILWKIGKRAWNYIIFVIGIFHVFLTYVLVLDLDDTGESFYLFPQPIFQIILALNIILISIMITETVLQKCFPDTS